MNEVNAYQALKKDFLDEINQNYSVGLTKSLYVWKISKNEKENATHRDLYAIARNPGETAWAVDYSFSAILLEGLTRLAKDIIFQENLSEEEVMEIELNIPNNSSEIVNYGKSALLKNLIADCKKDIKKELEKNNKKDLFTII